MASSPDSAVQTVPSPERSAHRAASSNSPPGESAPAAAAADPASSSTSSSPHPQRSPSSSGDGVGSGSVVSKRAYATEIVKALFLGGGGSSSSSSVGDVVGDFPCSFQRQSGRLYVSTEGLFFYSNLFGFERKIRIDYDDAAEVTTLRTTSLSVTTCGGEEYIFRSFEDREAVLDIISRFRRSGDDGVVGGAAAAHGGNDDAGVTALSVAALEEEATPALSRDEPSNDNDGERRESSPPPVPVPVPAERSQPLRPAKDAKRIMTDVGGTGDAGVTTCGADSANANDEIRKWEELKQNARAWESAIANLKISCKSVEDFFSLFLMDEAPHSLKLYSKSIGDKNISLGAWQSRMIGLAGEATSLDNAEKSLARMFRLERQAGLSTVKVERQQTYRRFGGRRACLRNATNVKGIRGVGDDLFFVEDIWFIEGSENGGVIVNVKYRVNFNKSTMLKSIILNRTAAETKEYYGNYSVFVRRKMKQTIPLLEESAPADEAPAAKMEAGWLEVLTSLLPDLSSLPDLSMLPTKQIPIVFLFVIFAMTIYRLKLRVRVLEEAAEEFEGRLSHLERMRFDMIPPAIELP